MLVHACFTLDWTGPDVYKVFHTLDEAQLYADKMRPYVFMREEHIPNDTVDLVQCVSTLYWTRWESGDFVV